LKAEQVLTAQPRVRLAHLPTPLEPLHRLTAFLGGPEIWVKRDDATGLGLGGNKVRKLEFLLGEALAQGCDAVVTGGVPQSNHVRQTAAAAAKLGLHCALAIFEGRAAIDDPDYAESGNIFLDALFGAEIVRADWREDRAARMEAIAASLRGRGLKPAIVPYGGSNAVGALGYLAMVQELAAQELTFDALIYATGSGGTQAGMALGLSAFLPHVQALAIEIDAESAGVEARARACAQAACARYDLPVPDDRFLTNISGHAGGRYGAVSAEMIEAVRKTAELEGLLLDPVYAGKAMAGLFHLVRSGALEKGQRVVFVHTGGMPALFAYRRAAFTP
jgi:L-cysteate sulfo-lyase